MIVLNEKYFNIATEGIGETLKAKEDVYGVRKEKFYRNQIEKKQKLQ